MVSKTRKLKGGEYRFSGAYGCTYSPAMKCTGDAERTPLSISKLMETTDGYKEFRKRPFLKKVDPDQRFFLWPVRFCTVSPADLTAENDLSPCPIVGSRFRPDLADAVLVIYSDGGTDLYHWKLNPKQYVEFFVGFGQLLEGLALLHSKNVVHLDIKPSNIVAKELPNGKFDFHFIDFSFTSPIRLFDKEDVPNANYVYWPYEYRFAKHGFSKAKITDDSITAWHGETLNFYDELKAIRYPTRAEAEGNFDMYAAKEKRVDKLDLLLKAVDVYSLGITFLQLYYSLIGHYLEYDTGVGIYSIEVVPEIKRANPVVKSIHNRIKRDLSQAFFEVVKGMIDPDLNRRFTAREAYEAFQPVIPSIRKQLLPIFVESALVPLNRPPIPAPPPTPVTPGFQGLQSILFHNNANVANLTAAGLQNVQSNVFAGGKRRRNKTQRKRR